MAPESNSQPLQLSVSALAPSTAPVATLMLSTSVHVPGHPRTSYDPGVRGRGGSGVIGAFTRTAALRALARVPEACGPRHRPWRESFAFLASSRRAERRRRTSRPARPAHPAGRRAAEHPCASPCQVPLNERRTTSARVLLGRPQRDLDEACTGGPRQIVQLDDELRAGKELRHDDVAPSFERRRPWPRPSPWPAGRPPSGARPTRRAVRVRRRRQGSAPTSGLPRTVWRPSICRSQADR